MTVQLTFSSNLQISFSLWNVELFNQWTEQIWINPAFLSLGGKANRFPKCQTKSVSPVFNPTWKYAHWNTASTTFITLYLFTCLLTKVCFQVLKFVPGPSQTSSSLGPPSTLPFISPELSFRGSHSLLCASLTPLSQWTQWFLMRSLCSALNTGDFLCLLMWWKASACHNTWEGPYYDN